MAGGKETPRQKLIGLMYLVLLAMLALNVSADIMNKFLQLNNSLGEFVGNAQGTSLSVLNSIEKKVQERGNKADEAEALAKAKDLHDKSEVIINWIEQVKQEIIEKTGGIDPVSGQPIGLKDGDKTAEILLGPGDPGPKGPGKAYELKTMLDGHITYLNEVAEAVAKAQGDSVEPLVFPNIALDGDEDPLFEKADANIRAKDFAHLNFDHTPMVASIAFLTEKQARVASFESSILEQMKGLVGVKDIKFDKIFAMSRAESNIVVSGRTYEAELFITATNDQITPSFKVLSGGGEIVAQGSTGKYTTKATTAGGKKDGELFKKQWVGEISMMGPTGDTITMVDTVTYFVAQPVLKVSAGSIAALYRNCANPISFTCPTLGADFSPSYSVTGGSLVKNGKAGEVIIYPSAKKVSVSVNSGGPIGTETFEVKSIPLPTIIVKPNGKTLTANEERTGLSAPPRSITIYVKPDASFKDALPKEANYYASSWTVSLVRGKRKVGQTMSFSKSKGDISSLRSQAKDGDRFVIEVKTVKRKNSKGSVETVNGLGLIVKTININK